MEAKGGAYQQLAINKPHIGLDFTPVRYKRNTYCDILTAGNAETQRLE